ncbi:MAG: right-handed parallel beta-helix repeat-containing protein, partial [Verrucomicrobia bacterium]|nr:right-handed parallel beta-helix repeat-containing protein [Verrucomicrobiota bacterium]
MAFVRRHRLVLVPLFAALMVGVGIVFLLRSGSEEPANDLAADAVFKAPVWEEVVELRDDHTRVYNVTHEVEYEDPVTGEKCTDTIVSKVREVGSGLCCRDGAGQWVPTIAEWETGGLGFRMKRGSWQIEVPMTLGGAYDYTVGGKTLAMRPTWILLSDGTNTVSLGSIDASVVGVINERDPSKLVFADALGAKSGVDIEFVLEPGALHQNVVLRAKPTLPEGFDAEDARLYVYTELGLDAYTAGDAVDVTIARAGVDVSAADLVTSRNTTDPIVFTVDEIIDGEPRETILHAFAESRVWDATGSANETRAARQLWRNPADSKTYLVESVPYSYVAEATGAVTLDYQNVNASITADEIWTANITYYVTANVTVSGGTAEDPVTLTIEPGTVVKFAAGKSLTIGEHGAIVAKGEPYSCIVFTSDQDDNSGEDLTSGFTGDPDAGDYGTAINIGVNASADCAIEFCKTGYASKGIDARRDFGAIRHCIVRDCTRGVYLYGSSRPDVFNNLVADCGTGVEFAGVGAGNCLVINNTIDGGYNSIFFGDTGGSATMTIHNNLLYNYSYAGLRRLGGGYSIYTSNNATMPFFYDEYQLPMAPYPYIGAGLGLQNNVYLTISPYDTTNTQLGAYFIDTGSTPGGGQLVNAGTGSPYDDPSAFSIEPPEVVGSDIDESDTWSKRSGDTGAVDIGYHHPRVDKVISNAVRKIGCTGSAVTLEIEPGVVVAFNGSETRLQFDPDATATPTLLCDGLPAEPIVLAGKPLVSMWVEAQYIDSSWSYPKAGVLLNDPTDEYTDA